jgi:hypothetical protein
MLVDPVKWMRGDYGGSIGIPSTSDVSKSIYDKIQLPHNAAYVGSLFSAMFSHTKCIHFPEVYGVYTGVAKKHTIDISDDYPDLVEKTWFSQNVGTYYDLKLADYLETPGFKHTRTAKLEVRMDEETTLGDVGELEGIQVDTNISVPDMNPVFGEEEGEDDAHSDSSSVSTSYLFEIESCKCSEDGDDMDESEGDEGFASATFTNVPVQLTIMEKCEGTLYQLMCLEPDTNKHMAWLSQILFALTFAQRTFGFIHNDLHSNNVMYVSTDKEYLHYKIEGQTFKVPTYGYIIKIIDFERGTGSVRVAGMKQAKMFVSDHFSPNEQAGGQYNVEPFHISKIESIKPNPSFDLVRLATSLFWDLFPEGPDYKEYKTNPIFNTLIRWMTLEDGTSVLFGKINQKHERYHGFELYKAIARYCKDTAIPRKEVQKLVSLYGATVPSTTLIDLLIISFVIAPGLRIIGSGPVQSIIVDSRPTEHWPPSRIRSSLLKYVCNSSLTSLAVVGETAPNRLALGAAIPRPPFFSNSANSASAMGWDGALTPTLLCPPVM